MGVAATSVVVASATTITAVTTAGMLGAGAVAVTTPGGTGTLPGAFTYLPVPTVTSVSPSAGPLAGGTTITVTGTGFAAGAVVRVGGVVATSLGVVDARR